MRENIEFAKRQSDGQIGEMMSMTIMGGSNQWALRFYLMSL
jgi:hypothetical protein